MLVVTHHCKRTTSLTEEKKVKRLKLLKDNNRRNGKLNRHLAVYIIVVREKQGSNCTLVVKRQTLIVAVFPLKHNKHIQTSTTDQTICTNDTYRTSALTV